MVNEIKIMVVLPILQMNHYTVVLHMIQISYFQLYTLKIVFFLIRIM